MPSSVLVLAALLAAPGDPVVPPASPALDLAPLVLDEREGPAEPASWRDALARGRWWVNLRYRFESVDQDGFSRDAHASTLRTVLGYETGVYEGFSALLEFEDVSPIGNEDYNSTVNGETDRPVVADPDGAEINQVYGQWAGGDGWRARLGRQRIVLDDQRFVGNVGWRQNEQTFDALTVTKSFGPVEGHWSFVTNANRVFGDSSPAGDHRMDSHLLNASADVGAAGRLTAFAYLLDYDSVETLSSNTFGLRLAGRTKADDGPSWLWTASVATQTDADDNPNDVDANYWHGEAGAEWRGVTTKLGAELLEGSGDPGDAFQTPLATLHKWNGWADLFLTTPDTGLQDVYLSVGGKVREVSLLAVWHDFSSDSDSLDYGTELDLQATYPVAEDMTLGLKYAGYDADDFATDTRKLWFWVSFSF